MAENRKPNVDDAFALVIQLATIIVMIAGAVIASFSHGEMRWTWALLFSVGAVTQCWLLIRGLAAREEPEPEPAEECTDEPGV